MTRPTSMDKLRQHTTKFMWLEEMREYRNNVKAETMSVEKKGLDRDFSQKVGFVIGSLSLYNSHDKCS